MKKNTILSAFILSLLFTVITPTVDTYAAPLSLQSVASAKNQSTVMPMSDMIIWRYKTVNGKTYRR